MVIDVIFRVFILFIIVISLANIFSIIRDYTTKKLELDKLKIVGDMKIEPNDLSILDTIINEIFVEYKTTHFEYRSPDELYITSEEQKKMIIDLLDSTLSIISDNLYTKLSLYYKREYIDDLIYKKIEMLVLSYVVEVNGGSAFSA